MPRTRALIVLVLTAAAVLLGVAAVRPAPARSLSPAIGPAATAAPAAGTAAAFNSADFIPHITNRWLPLRVGSFWIYRGFRDGRHVHERTWVTSRTKTILGVSCTVVRDVTTVHGNVVEDTNDWFAQDKQGNVWYFGEATATYDAKGNLIGTVGSWEAGVDGATAGVWMPGQPKVGQLYYQEHYKDVAQDRYRVVSLKGSATVPYGNFTKCVTTTNWTPLEPTVRERKCFVAGVGTGSEDVTTGPKEFAHLVKFHK
jgi:hypothetical protein